MNSPIKSVLCFLLLIASAARSAGASDATTRTFRLDFVPDGFSETTTAVDYEREVVFKKEPEYSGGEVVRGVIGGGLKTSGQFAFAVDRDAGKLYLDANRNFDLTDDPGGVHQATETTNWSQEFKNVRIDIDADGTTVPCALDIDIYLWGHCMASIRSGWRAGDVVLGDRQVSLGVVDTNLDGAIGRFDTLYLDSTALSDRLSLPETLFHSGMNYDISFAFVDGAGGKELEATFAPSKAPMGALVVEGQWVKRLVMTGPKAPTVVLDAPGTAPVAVPAGHYTHQRVTLERGRNTSTLRARCDKSLQVLDSETARLAVGGPLHNSVEASRDGLCLELNYVLAGIGGETYPPPGSLRKKRPTFAIYKGPARVASGKFDYG